MDDLEVLNWLTPIDYSRQQSDFISRRQAGTGQWLLDSAEYQAWLTTSEQTLFCPGIPGAGKTIITSIVVDDLLTKVQNDDSLGIAYLYCDIRRQHEQKLEDLLASLLKQLTEVQSPIPDSVKSLYSRHKDERTRASIDEISEVLNSVVANYSRVFIVIDALGECQVSDWCRSRFLSEVFNLQARSGANIFATSRYIPEIVERFEGCISMEIHASDADMLRYLDGHMSRLPSPIRRNMGLQEIVKAEIVRAADGMFLLAQLHLDSLIGKKTPRAIRNALKELPTGSDTYVYAYREVMRQIERQDAAAKELAKLVLTWITCARRHLTAVELQHAIAVEIGASELDQDNLPWIERMVSVCAGLVTIDEESKIIHYIHYSAQEYFQLTLDLWFPNAHADITRTCITYLSFRAFESGRCRTDEEFEERLRRNPLYDYAAHNWGYHARWGPISDRTVIEFLENEVKVEAASQAMMAVKQHSDYTQEVPLQVTGLHLAAYFGLLEIVHSWVSHRRGLDFEDNYGRTSLSWVAERGHKKVVELLLEKGAEANSRDTNGQTPLHWAAKKGHEMTVETLIRTGAYIDSTDQNGSTALHESIRNDNQAVQELLINFGANLDIKDRDDQTASDLAWSKKRLDWSAYEIDILTETINQGAQARCEVLRRRDGEETPKVIFRKVFNVSESAGKKVRKYLLREHRILQKLNHPFIVSYLGYEEDVRQKTAALYMEFCEGGDLQRRHTQSRPDFDGDSDDSCFVDTEPYADAVSCHPVPLREDEVWSITFQLAAAMAYLHHGLSIKRNDTFSFEKHWESVIHRDIKPANVILKTAEDGSKVAKLCDLGLVKAVLDAEKQTMGIGTRDYSPPEVRLRKGWTPKGDIFSFGMTIDDLYKEAEPQPQLKELLDNCKSADKSARPSSLSILEIVREYVADHDRRICLSLHELLGSGPGGYLLQSLEKIASGLDEYAAWGNEIRLRRKRILGRLKLLCDDGAGDLFDKYSESLHLSILLHRQDKLKQLLVTADVNKKWENSGWTPLHLAIQEHKQDVAELLIECGADLEITDKYTRRPEYYRDNTWAHSPQTES